MARYHFITAFRVGTHRRQVWELINDPITWPTWWRWLKRVELLENSTEGDVGTRHRFAFGTALPYTLSFETRVVRKVAPALLESRTTGELEGSGLWQLVEPRDGATDVTYTWLVETTKRWMNVVAPVARPAFSWNHDRLMRDFAIGLARTAGADLHAVENRTMSPSTPGFFELPAADV